MQNLKQEEDLDGTRRPRCPKPVFIGAKAFMEATKTRDAFFIYVFPSLNVEPHPHETLSQYQEFKDVFEKKNANSLPKHRPYSCTIDLEDGVEPPFEPIYIFSRDKLVALHEYIDKNLKKRFIQHSKCPTFQVPLFSLSKRKMIFYKFVSIIMN
jgi:hypothetical protein